MNELAVRPAFVVPFEGVGYGAIAVGLSSVLEVVMLGSEIVVPLKVYVGGKPVALPTMPEDMAMGPAVVVLFELMGYGSNTVALWFELEVIAVPKLCEYVGTDAVLAGSESDVAFTEVEVRFEL